MNRQQHAVIWTNLLGTPEKMGDLVLNETQNIFTYSQDYIQSQQAGFCLLGDPTIWQNESIVYPVSERISIFPRLMSLLPGTNPRNLQRRHYLDLLRTKYGKEPANTIETQWQLLTMAGHGGIGHVDIFSDDLTADGWYKRNHSQKTEPVLLNSKNNRSQLWAMLKREVMDEQVEFNSQVIESVLGATPSVGGMIPKLLVSIDPSSSDIVIYPPRTTEMVDVVLKIEPPEYKGLLDLESLCLELHKEAGFNVPNHYRYHSNGLDFLAIERFDIKGGNILPMESIFSVIATGNHLFRETGDILLDELGDVFDKLGNVATLNKETNYELYRRLLMALLTGNGDMHLENISLLGGIKDCALSPIYDPAPMRAWPRHNMVSAIPFDPDNYKNHTEFFVTLGEKLGLTKIDVQQSINDAVLSTEHYVDRVMALSNVPQNQRNQLADIAKKERDKLITYS